ncbi:hypothetical protein QBC37DRAFT_276373 [Rhypophila decipiens]|uniref:Nuclear segregation protein n=1 Tax=Rhypophila decipiens TaxID=261697 RepID=A0AAN6YEV5_9PEZI|nr:hypothetical protein QBC37DRAFT_276373 [Rhypophila decipiens]
MADTAAATTAPAANLKPTKPDQDAFNKALEKAKKEHDEVMTRFNAIKAKIELATPNKNKETQTPTQKRRQELISQLNEIRQQQAGGKSSRNAKLDQIKRLDEQVKSRIAEQKAARGKVAFKSVEELDREIQRLDSQVNGGMMKLVDEKKALGEISNLKKQRKNFSQFDESQKQIDSLREKIKEIKDSMEDPEAKALSERYNKLQAELDAIKAEQDEAYKSLSSLRDERSKLHAEQQEKYLAMKKIQDDYYTAKKAFGNWEREQREKHRERMQAERERIAKERKMERAQKMLAEASDPAYLEEIRRAKSLLHFFDPSHHAPVKAPLLADKGLGAKDIRKVDDSGIKGMKLLRKEDREEDLFPSAKKGKKGKKATPAPTESTKFSCPPSVIEDCACIGIEPPMIATDVPAALEKIKAKLAQFEKDQPEQTRKNIEKAKKEIERLEAEEAAEASGATNGTNGKTEDKAVADLADGVKEATIEEKKETETAAAA